MTLTREWSKRCQFLISLNLKPPTLMMVSFEVFYARYGGNILGADR